MADIDLATVWGGPFFAPSRIQTGRGGGPNPGNAPNSTAILPQNARTGGPPVPGLLVTETINIGPLTGGIGADEFLIWWHVYSFDTEEDIRSDYGFFAGVNSPSVRQIGEADPGSQKEEGHGDQEQESAAQNLG